MLLPLAFPTLNWVDALQGASAALGVAAVFGIISALLELLGNWRYRTRDRSDDNGDESSR